MWWYGRQHLLPVPHLLPGPGSFSPFHLVPFLLLRRLWPNIFPLCGGIYGSFDIQFVVLMSNFHCCWSQFFWYSVAARQHHFLQSVLFGTCLHQLRLMSVPVM